MYLKVDNSIIVAWVVSNMNDVRNARYQYAKELAKHIRVDIFGKSTGLQCPGDCREMSHKYKFYLSFENSNCRQYITEKLGMNALKCALSLNPPTALI